MPDTPDYELRSCARCVHVMAEHANGKCEPTIEGGSPCDCIGFVVRPEEPHDA